MALLLNTVRTVSMCVCEDFLFDQSAHFVSKTFHFDSKHEKDALFL